MGKLQHQVWAAFEPLSMVLSVMALAHKDQGALAGYASGYGGTRDYLGWGFHAEGARMLHNDADTSV